MAFVTGAARGQGRAHAVRLADDGADIIAIDVCATGVRHHHLPDGHVRGTRRDGQRRWKPPAARCSPARSTSVTSPRQQQVVADGIEQFGRLDIVVANAGRAELGPDLEMSEEQWDTVIDVNLNGTWRTIRAAVPAMIEAGNGGSIIIVSSSAGLKATPGNGHYSASKHGLVALTNALAIEAGRVRDPGQLHPPVLDRHADGGEGGDDGDLRQVSRSTCTASRRCRTTPSTTRARRACMEFMTPEEVSDVVAWLAGDGSATISGSPDRRRPRHGEVLRSAGQHQHRDRAVPDDLRAVRAEEHAARCRAASVVPRASSSPSCQSVASSAWSQPLPVITCSVDVVADDAVGLQRASDVP